MRIIPMLRSFVREEAGASLLEYGLLVALIAVVSIVAIRTLGTRIREVFETVVAELNNAGV
jgi:pilus assembly protein Flp/PilA